MKKRKSHNASTSTKATKAIMYLVFIIYIMVLLKVILFKNANITQIINWDVAGKHLYNLVPFASVKQLWQMESRSLIWKLSQIAGNVLVFLPLGYMVPLLFKNMRRFGKVLLLSFGISLVFELMQYLFGLGCMDVDDLILNLIGGVLGYGAYRLLAQICKTEKALYTTTLILVVLCAILAFIVAKTVFGMDLDFNSVAIPF